MGDITLAICARVLSEVIGQRARLFLTFSKEETLLFALLLYKFRNQVQARQNKMRCGHIN